MEVINIKGKLRDDLGKRASKAIRREGRIPCELYGNEKNIHFSVKPADVKHLIYTPEFKLADVEIDGEVYRTIMKNIQFHPVTDEVLHLDFLKLEEGRKVKVEVPIHFEGIAAGVKNGGKLTEKVKRVSIKTLPENLMAEVVLDVTSLDLGQSVRIRDIAVGDEIEILNNPSIPVATVEIPRALKSAEEGAVDELEEGEEGSEAEDTDAVEADDQAAAESTS